ncbi:MAG TPA: HAD family phosphatase [Firmicutes bacterium]|nr:HAD family phosphatase [Bacillota bacterium]
MSRIRLVAIDCDDTLLASDLSISEENRRAIHGAMEQGVMVTLATGRMYQSCLPFARELGIEGPLITYNGALVKETDGRVWFCETIPREVAIRVATLAAAQGLCLLVYVDDELYVKEITPAVGVYLSVSRVIAHAVGDLAAFLASSGEPTKLLFVDEPEVLKSLEPRFQKDFAGELEITSSKRHFLELMKTGVSKGRALEEIAKNLGYRREEIMSIGDGNNDIPLLKAAGIGVAMENGAPKLKEVADYVTLSHDASGVAHAINRFVLNKGR